MSEPNVIDHLTGLFGSQASVAEAAGISQAGIAKHKGTNAFGLPLGRMRNILQAGIDQGLPITPADFFPELYQ